VINILKLQVEAVSGVTLNTKLGGLYMFPASNATLKLPIPPLISNPEYLLYSTALPKIVDAILTVDLVLAVIFVDTIVNSTADTCDAGTAQIT